MGKEVERTVVEPLPDDRVMDVAADHVLIRADDDGWGFALAFDVESEAGAHEMEWTEEVRSKFFKFVEHVVAMNEERAIDTAPLDLQLAQHWRGGGVQFGGIQAIAPTADGFEGEAFGGNQNLLVAEEMLRKHAAVSFPDSFAASGEQHLAGVIDECHVMLEKPQGAGVAFVFVVKNLEALHMLTMADEERVAVVVVKGKHLAGGAVEEIGAGEFEILFHRPADGAVGSHGSVPLAGTEAFHGAAAVDAELGVDAFERGAVHEPDLDGDVTCGVALFLHLAHKFAIHHAEFVEAGVGAEGVEHVHGIKERSGAGAWRRYDECGQLLKLGVVQ